MRRRQNWRPARIGAVTYSPAEQKFLQDLAEALRNV
jgi:hypothetical protein